MAKQPAGKQPDYNIVAAIQEDGVWKNQQVGAAWKNEEGRITFKFDRFINFGELMPFVKFTLFPNASKASNPLPRKKNVQGIYTDDSDLTYQDDGGVEDIPF